MAAPELILCDNLEAAAAVARDRISIDAAKVIAAHGRFSLCVDGGRPTQRLLGLLAESSLDWSKVSLWLGDERRVPIADSRSNRGLIERLLLGKVTPRPAFHAPDGAAENGGAAALDFAALWQRENPSGVDVLLLGMGPDGHTASLFPDSPVLAETSRFAASVPAPTTVEPKVPRLTLTPPAILAAKSLVLFAVGAEKKAPLHRLLAATGDEATTPARLVWRYSGIPIVIADRAAMGH